MTDETNGGVAACRLPIARREPVKRVFHGDAVIDPYEWMRDKQSPEVRDYVAAQNAYCDARMAGLAGLRGTLFDELKAHVQETDMSVPVRMDGYWYFARTREGSQYAVQCRVPVRGEDDWTPPEVGGAGDEGGSAVGAGSLPGEQVVFDANREAEGHDFFALGGLSVSKDGRWMLYGVDTRGDERYDFRIRDLDTGDELPERLEGIGAACFTPDARWVFYVTLDDAWRPCEVRRHRVGSPVEQDEVVFHEDDERFWVGVGMSFDEHSIVICSASKTSSEVWMLSTATPEGEFSVFIARKDDVEYDVSFACFEGAGADGADIPVAVVYHNAQDPNFEIDVIDMRTHQPPYTLGEGVRVAVGSPYGCARGDDMEAGAGAKPAGTAYSNPANPRILQGAHGLAIEGIAIHRHFVTLAYRTDGLPHVAAMTKTQAAEDFLAGRPWSFRELMPPALDGDWDVPGRADDGAAEAAGGTLPGATHRLYSIGTGGNPSYDAPRMRYTFSSYTRPGELHEYDPATGHDELLKRARVLGDFDPREYMERRVWVTARDGERIPVSLVWRRGHEPAADSAMFITGYGAYEISSDPGFSVARLSLLDRGVLYAVPHVRGGGEMGRAWYEQGRRLNKRHTFEDFIDVTAALQDAGLADAHRTVAYGGSAGGLLMGAIANMAPQLYAGIEADVPFVDALTSILDPSLPLTVTEWDEWGDPLHDADVYRYMKSYSPYENAPEGADGEAGAGAASTRSLQRQSLRPFPRIFATTSMNDTRVLYVEPLKWVSRLQAAGIDAIIKIEVEAGHGGTSGRYKQGREVSYENAWCRSIMGLTR